MTSTAITRAHHDLNGITSIEIIGWAGRVQVIPQPDDSRCVPVEVPKRIPEESWIFNVARRGVGVLRCFTDLLGSPRLIAEGDARLGSAAVMTVYLPADRIGGITVTAAQA